jgi:uncharacterized protein YgbK (DUF1537 family)
VIDDDPTGTKTVHDIELFTTWNKQTLAEALQNEPRLFYLLTNSRSMPESDAVQLNHETAQQLAVASEETKIGFVVVSQSDSTLRGLCWLLRTAVASRAAERPIAKRGFLALFFGCGGCTVRAVHGSLLRKMVWMTISIP